MREPAEMHPDLDLSDEAADAGVRAWFEVKQVRPGRHILRDRIRAAVAAALAAREAANERSAAGRYRPTNLTGNAPQRASRTTR